MASNLPTTGHAPPENVTQRYRPKVTTRFTYLPSDATEETLAAILAPFTIEHSSEEEETSGGDDKTSILEVTGPEKHSYGVEVMQELCRHWCRQNRIQASDASSEEPCIDKSPSGWLEVEKYVGDGHRVRKVDTVQMLQLKSMSFGSFKDQATFVNHACIGQRTHTLQVKFEHDLRKLNVVMHQRNTDVVKKIEFGYNDLEAYVVVDVLEDGFRMFLPLLHPPRMYASAVDIPYPYIAHPQIQTEGLMWNRDTMLSMDPMCQADIIGTCSVICLEYRCIFPQGSASTQSPMWSLLARLKRANFHLYFAAINGVSCEKNYLKPTPDDIPDFDTLYAIESLYSRGSKFTDRCTPALMKMIYEAPVELAAPAITEVANVWLEEDRFCDLEKALHTELETARKKTEDNPNEMDELPPHFVNIRRVVVTPTRLLFLRAETVAKNRVVREYGEERFLRVAFRDEDYRKLMAPVPRFVTKITDRIKMVLKDGILVGSRRYHFLACSNSQLREHGCWFYNSEKRGKHSIGSIRRYDL